MIQAPTVTTLNTLSASAIRSRAVNRDTRSRFLTKVRIHLASNRNGAVNTPMYQCRMDTSVLSHTVY